MNRLEEKFRYDDQGLPRVWKPEDDMDSYFQQAKNEVCLQNREMSKFNIYAYMHRLGI